MIDGIKIYYDKAQYITMNNYAIIISFPPSYKYLKYTRVILCIGLKFYVILVCFKKESFPFFDYSALIVVHNIFGVLDG